MLQNHRAMTICVLYFLALAIAVREASPALPRRSFDANSSPCDPTACPNPVCADPTPPSGGACCPSCDSSKCLFKGCVHWAAFGPQWKPNPCTLCTCRNGEPVCSAMQCVAPECFGYPLKNSHGGCCPECDYGISLDQCRPVVVKNETLSVGEGDSRCDVDVLLHDCDKSIVIKNGRVFMCQSVKKDVEIKSERCTAGQKLTYQDVVDCALTHADIMDYDTKSSQCEMYVA